jgi:LDH2 family malate/lactate/ureidoglycolate dehydrogenase
MRTDALIDWISTLFTKTGVPESPSRLVAESLVAADLEGIASHGVMLVPMYVDRLLAGSISKKTQARVVHDSGAAVALDAGNMLGQLSSRQAVVLVAERAKKHGLASVAVRNGFHFGTAGYWARALAAEGLVGMAFSNTRPLMPPPGGAERIVGNNPLAIALPSDQDVFLTDMAMSATAMGKIRLADSAGQPIPEGWATDAEGRPTTDPAAAIKGMLLPAAGPKGFGLALAIDLLCGGLSGGAITDEVNPLYGDPKQPYRCSHLFLSIDPAAFGITDLSSRVTAVQQKTRNAKRAPGSDTIYAPGDLERTRRKANADECPVPPDVIDKLKQAERKLT